MERRLLSGSGWGMCDGSDVCGVWVLYNMRVIWMMGKMDVMAYTHRDNSTAGSEQQQEQLRDDRGEDVGADGWCADQDGQLPAGDEDHDESSDEQEDVAEAGGQHRLHRRDHGLRVPSQPRRELP